MKKNQQQFVDFFSLSQDCFDLLFGSVLEETIELIAATFIDNMMEDPILLYRHYYQVFPPSSLGLLCPTTATTNNSSSFLSKSSDNARALTKRKRSYNYTTKNQALVWKEDNSYIVKIQIPRLLKDSNRRQSDTLYYNWNESTEYNYSVVAKCCVGKYKHIRDRLDYSYHKMYSQSRQLLQDRIIDSVLNITTTTTMSSSSSSSPWIIFTAGVMGAGKTHSIRRLRDEGKLTFLSDNQNEEDDDGVVPLLPELLTVDPDCIRHLLPEFDVYVKRCPDKAGTYTQKEAGLIAEIATKVALSEGCNVVVDGSLRNSDWYINYFQHLRREQQYQHIKNKVDSNKKVLRIAIIHVTAPFPTILKRTKQRAKETGRVVPIELLKRSIEEVPLSVDILKSHVDYFLQVHNP